MFKIRNKKTGLWKKAGFYGGWGNRGKVWATRAALSGHLALYNDNFRRAKHDMSDWEIVELEEVVKATYSVKEYREMIKNR